MQCGDDRLTSDLQYGYCVPSLRVAKTPDRPFGKVITEIGPILESGIAAKNIERTGLHGVITANAAPQSTQRIISYMLMGDPFDVATQLRIIVSTFDSMPETFFNGNPKSRNLWRICLYSHIVTKLGKYGQNIAPFVQMRTG